LTLAGNILDGFMHYQLMFDIPFPAERLSTMRLALLFLTLLLVGTLSGQTPPNVPKDLQKQPVADAVVEISKIVYNGVPVKVTVVLETWAGVDSGKVIDTDPKAGAAIDPGKGITLYVSTGPPLPGQVPAVVGKTPGDANSALAAVDLKSAKGATGPNNNIPVGNVTAQSPGAGTRAPSGSAVTLNFSSGPTPMVPVPGVIGLPKATAASLLTQNGLQEKDGDTKNDPKVPSGSVISLGVSPGQSVSPGEMVPAGTTIILTLSSGPAPSKVESIIDIQGFQNAVTIATELGAITTAFGFQAGANNKIIVSCKQQSCPEADLMAVEAVIRGLARSNAYHLLLPVFGTTATEARDKVNQNFAPSITAEVSLLDPPTILLKSDTTMDAQLSAIRTLVKATPAPFSLPLRRFCLSGVISGPGPDPYPYALPCNPPEKEVQAANAAAVAAALAKDPNFAVTAQGTNRVLITCTAVCGRIDIARVSAAVATLSWPSPAYIQDFEVPFAATAYIAGKLNGSSIAGVPVTADVVGTGKIRLKSDAPISEDDVRRVMRQYIFAPPAPLDFRLFYQPASTIVTSLTPPSGGGGGGAANSGGGSGGSGSGGGGGPASGGAGGSSSASSPTTTVVASSTISSPPASVAPAAGGSSSSSTSGSPSAAPAGAAPAASGGASTPTPSSAGSLTAAANTSTTITTPASAPSPTPAAPPAPPAPALTAGMAAIVNPASLTTSPNDTIVFTDTTNDSTGTTWQRVRLLTMLDLPRPEVLMNVWSYQASSPDGKEILHSAEKVRGLVAAHNDALENSIQYGWSYLSHAMKNDLLHNIGPTLPEDQLLPLGVTPASQLFGAPETFFDHDFYNYITQKFVADQPGCETSGGCLKPEVRSRWGFCPRGKYCLGFTQAFQPLKPNLTNVLLAALSAKRPLKTILITIGCMEGKWEVYPDDCFPDRDLIKKEIQTGTVGPSPTRTVETSAAEGADGGEIRIPRRIRNQVTVSGGGSMNNSYSLGDDPKTDVNLYAADEHRGQGPHLTITKTTSTDKLTPGRTVKYTITVTNDGDAPTLDRVTVTDTTPADLKVISMSGVGWKCSPQAFRCTTDAHVDGKGKSFPEITVRAQVVSEQATCLKHARTELIKEHASERLSCQVLDEVALRAQERCQVAQTFPLSCFTIQAAQSFASTDSVSTFPPEQLNELAEQPLAYSEMVRTSDDELPKAGTTRIGLLRAAVADFLFNYKMAQEFPQDFVPYDLQHSAQELNAELNQMVVAFNDDVAALSRHLSDHLENEPNKNNLFEVWRNHKSFLSDGIITLRGIGGIQSTVDTTTQNFFNATQAQSLSGALASMGGGSGSGSGTGSTAAQGNAAALSALEKGALNVTTGLPALAALLPTPAQAQIGRQLSFYATPHTLPGASSAELDVQLIAGDNQPPALYQAGNATSTADADSEISRFNVTTRVRVESIKLFELSSFSALVQRPRAKFPLVPPFVEIPFIGSLASLPLPGAKEYHRSTAIVSAVLVPTATDLAYGIDFAHDRLITDETRTTWGQNYQMRSVSSLTQFQTDSERTPIRAFHKAMVNCLATGGGLVFPGGARNIAPERCSSLEFRTVPPEF
jgi:uncharacterized repeat protein (TIGR01451 family)